MSDPKLEEIAEAVAGKRCEYRGPGIVGPCAEFHEVCAATQRTNTLAILAALREAAEAAARQERERLAQEIEDEALKIPLCTAFGRGSLAGSSKYNVAMWAVSRIRRSRPEESKPE